MIYHRHPQSFVVQSMGQSSPMQVQPNDEAHSPSALQILQRNSEKKIEQSKQFCTPTDDNPYFPKMFGLRNRQKRAMNLLPISVPPYHLARALFLKRRLTTAYP